MNPALLALAISCLGPGDDADVIAPAAVSAVESRARSGLAPVTGSPAEDLCLVATFIRHESGARIVPMPESHDARAGQSCSVLQQDCRRIVGWSLRHQIAAWLADAAQGGLPGICGTGPKADRVARERATEAHSALAAHLLSAAR